MAAGRRRLTIATSTLDGERLTLHGARADANQGRRPARIRLRAASIVRTHVVGADSIFNAPTRTPGVSQVTIAGPFNAGGPGRHAKPPPAGRLLAAAGRTALREDDSQFARVPRLPPSARGQRSGDGDAARSSTARAATSGTFESGMQRAVARVLVDPQFLFRFEREPATSRRARRSG